MQVQLLVERDQNECIVKLAGTAYKFKRNEYGDLVTDITDVEHIKRVSDPHNTAFKAYSEPKEKFFETPPGGRVGFFHPLKDNTEALPVPEPESEPESDAASEGDKGAPDLPRYPLKGSKRPPKRSES